MNEIKRALADYCRDAGRSPAKALAELAAELMLSDGADPLHVYGPEFIEEIDRTMLEKKPGDSRANNQGANNGT